MFFQMFKTNMKGSELEEHSEAARPNRWPYENPFFEIHF